MAQHDMDIANAAGAAVRADINNALTALVSLNSGATEPATMFAYQLWQDTTTGSIKQRNSANTAWTELGGALTWVTPTFVSSWVDAGGGSAARYAKDLTNGIVYMKGLVIGGSNTTTTTIFTLPVGMRSSSNIRISQPVSSGIGIIHILASGAVQFLGAEPHTGNANAWLSISATFKGEI